MEKGAYVWKRSGGRYNSTTLEFEFEFEFETFLQHGGCAMVSWFCTALQKVVLVLSYPPQHSNHYIVAIDKNSQNYESYSVYSYFLLF